MIGAGHCTDVCASKQKKLTVTALSFQPLASGAGVAVAVMIGGVPSTTREALTSVPVASVAVT